MIRIQAAPKHHLWWLQQYTGARFTNDVKAIEAIDHFEMIRGMVAYDGWTETACMIHIAVDHPIYWRRLLGPGLEYPFLQGGRKLVLGLIAESNKKSCAFTRAVGFRQISRIRDGHAEGDDLILFEMRKEEWLAGAGHIGHRKAA